MHTDECVVRAAAFEQVNSAERIILRYVTTTFLSSEHLLVAYNYAGVMKVVASYIKNASSLSTWRRR